MDNERALHDGRPNADLLAELFAADGAMQMVAEALESEVGAVVEQVHASAEELHRATSDSKQTMTTLEATAQRLDVRGQEVEREVEWMKQATGKNAEHCRRMARDASQASDAVGHAVRQTRDAEGGMRRLADLVGGIGEVVTLIETIANQTKLLALNATIEAQRAGEAGRGFGVVASEVKSLARQTAEATGRISTRIEEIQSASGLVVSSIGEVGQQVGTVDATVRQIRDAMDRQVDDMASMSEKAEALVESARDMAAGVADLRSIGAASAESSKAAASRGQTLGRDIKGLEDRLRVVIRSSGAGNRRRYERIPVDLAASLRTSAGGQLQCRLQDLSLGGALAVLQDPAELSSAPGPVELDVPLVGALQASVVRASQRGVRLGFEPEAATHQGLVDFLASTKAVDQPFIAEVSRRAKQIEGLFEAALQAGRITEAGLFSEDYQAIEGTDPQQYMTPFVDLTDELLPQIQEPMLDFDPRVSFCAAVDRRGFLPTHNHKYSQPQSHDPEWNKGHCRNRRLFNDRTGLAAGHNTQPHLLQTYLRDMGHGEFVMMKDLSVPIYVRGRHWGGLRLGYRP